jgi:mono/diheme cytochrome c family protein
VTRSPLAALAALVLLAGAVHVVARHQGETSMQEPATPTAPAAPPARAPSVPPGNVEEGRKIYMSHGCYQCHGFEGQGSAATGPRLGPRPAPYPYFSSYVRKPALLMPPYTAKVLSDQDIAHIYAFLRARAEPPPVESIDLLR